MLCIHSQLLAILLYLQLIGAKPKSAGKISACLLVCMLVNVLIVHNLRTTMITNTFILAKTTCMHMGEVDQSCSITYIPTPP